MRRLLPTLVFSACLAVPALADPPPAALVRAVRLDHPIVVDGLLDEPVWKTECTVTNLIQRDPDNGAAPRQRTEVRLAFDDEALYVGARMYDSSPDSVLVRLSRRDQDAGGDQFAIYLDPFHDRRTGYYFAVAASGVQFDGVLSNDDWSDDSWDGVWHSHVRRDAQGWTCEMKIPFSQLRFRASPNMIWGVNFGRDIPRANENDQYVYRTKGQSGFVSRFAELGGLDGVRNGRTVELTPYATSKAEALVHEPGDPFHDGTQMKPAAGGDLRTSLGSNLTLNATVNPDFGQVEIDPAVVNLSDVETFFNEKRPFFTEGSSVFHTGNNGANDYWGFNWPDPVFFYSRRIGRSPQGSPPGADFTDSPLGTHILGAAKITGALAPGWDVGTVQALTSREEATLQTAGVRTKAAVEPLSYYGVFRGMHPIHDGRQGLGLMATTTLRSFGDDHALESQINRSGVVTALDGWTFLDPKRTWVLSGWAAGTNVTGTSARITSLQTSSKHYFQRPDVSYLGVDPNATSLTGYGARVWLNKQNGRLLSNSAIGFMSPGFDNDDLGFLFRSDLINTHVGLGWQWNEPNAWRQYANVITATAASWDMGGDRVLTGEYIGGQIEQRNRWSWRGSMFALASALDARRTRGGPLMASKGSLNFQSHFDGNSTRPLFFAIDVNPSTGGDGSHSVSVSPSLNWKAAPNLSFQIGPNWVINHADAQYVTTTVDAAATETFGIRYVFAELDQKTAGAEVRMDYALTPNLTFQLYAQPLVSSGRYTNYRHLARPRSYAFVGSPADAGASDFTFRTVRGNAVLRWEYDPGSTIYVVWTQDRTDIVGDGEFDLNASLSQLARTPANNVFLIKATRHFEL